MHVHEPCTTRRYVGLARYPSAKGSGMVSRCRSSAGRHLPSGEWRCARAPTAQKYHSSDEVAHPPMAGHRATLVSAVRLNVQARLGGVQAATLLSAEVARRRRRRCRQVEKNKNGTHDFFSFSISSSSCVCSHCHCHHASALSRKRASSTARPCRSNLGGVRKTPPHPPAWVETGTQWAALTLSLRGLIDY